MPSRRVRAPAAARPGDPAAGEAVEALMRASKVMAAAVAYSLEVADPKVTLPQLRVLVMVHDGGPLNMSAVAQRLGVNPSNASRTCDRLVRGGLLDRRDAEDDRRNVSLTLTPSGRRLVAAMLRQRAVIFSHVVDRMDDAQRARLTKGLAAFADAARDLTEEGIGLSDDDGHLLSYLA